MQRLRTPRHRWLIALTALALAGCWTGPPRDAAVESHADPLDDPWLEGIEAEPVVVVPATTDAPRPAPRAAQATLALTTVLTPDNTASAIVRPASATRERERPSAPVESPPASEPEPEPLVEPPPTPSPIASATYPSAPEVEPEPAVPDPITSADFQGRFTFVGGQRQRDEVAAAVERTVESLPLAFRAIARRRLLQAAAVDDVIDIAVSGDKVTTAFSAGFNVTCELDGGAVPARATDGQKLDVKLRSKGTKLVQLVAGKGGAAGTVVFVLSADRNTLTVHRKISSPRLPVPVSYRLRYSRS